MTKPYAAGVHTFRACLITAKAVLITPNCAPAIPLVHLLLCIGIY